MKGLLKKIETKNTLTENQIKTLVLEALVYYLIDDITFQKFLKLINRIGERSEILAMPKVKKIIKQLLTLSQYACRTEMHREKIIDRFNISVSQLLQ